MNQYNQKRIIGDQRISQIEAKWERIDYKALPPIEKMIVKKLLDLLVNYLLTLELPENPNP